MLVRGSALLESSITPQRSDSETIEDRWGRLARFASKNSGARTEYGTTDCAMLLFVSLGKCRRNNIHERPPTNQEHSDGWRIGAFRRRLIRATVKAQTIPTPEV
jgi:hypothetical protein